MAQTALIVEPDSILRSQYTQKLRREFDVLAVGSAQEAIDMLDSDIAVDVVVLDVSLGRNNGVEFMHEIRSYDDWLDVPVVILSSIPHNRLPSERLETYGVSKLLYKPQTPPKELLTHVRRAIA